jgi:hypothetical protein
MERVTFPVPEVQQALARFVLCKLDVDAAANREACARLQRGGAVPTFVVLGADGVELSRWVGALAADELVAKLGEIEDDVAARLLAAGDDHGARATIHASRGDLEPALQELAALEASGGADAAAMAEAVSWLLCSTLRDQQRWSDLDRAAWRYLDRCTGGAHTDDARVAIGLASFARTGTTTPELDAHVERLVEALGEPFPRRSRAQAASEWVDRMNSAEEELTRLGRAALPALHRTLRDGEEGAADHAGTVIGRIRDPESHAFLCDLLDRARLDTERRTVVVNSLGAYKDACDRPRMLALARSGEAPRLRAAAIDAIGAQCLLDDGTTERAIADALSSALDSRDLGLRMAALQAMGDVRAPLDLERLLDAMDDSRLMFLDVRVCDNALWIFEQQIGREVVDPGGAAMERVTPALAEFLARWHAEARARLRWDAANACWVEGPQVSPDEGEAGPRR